MAKKEIEKTLALAPIKARVTKMTSVVSDLVIKDPETLKQAITIRVGIKDVAKQIKTWKEARTKPAMETVALVRSDAKPLEDFCEQATRELDEKMIKYNRQVQEKADKETEKITGKVEAGKMSVETAAKKLEVIPEQKTTVRGDKGAVSFKKVKNFRVTDVSKLPVQYILPDTGAIRRAMYANIELAGVEYFEEEQVAGRA